MTTPTMTLAEALARQLCEKDGQNFDKIGATGEARMIKASIFLVSLTAWSTLANANPEREISCGEGSVLAEHSTDYSGKIFVGKNVGKFCTLWFKASYKKTPFCRANDGNEELPLTGTINKIIIFSPNEKYLTGQISYICTVFK